MSTIEANVDENFEDNSIEGENGPHPSNPKEKKKECPECPAGAPPWMATFADMATLLMAFFVLILSFANVNVPKFEQVSGSLAVAFGVSRIIPKIVIPKGETLLSLEFTPSDAKATLIPNKNQSLEDPNKDYVKQLTESQESMFIQEDELTAVLEALEEEIAAGLVQINTQGEEIIVDVSESGSSQEPLESQIGLGNLVPQEMLEVAKKISDLKTDLISPIKVRNQINDRSETAGNDSGDGDQKYNRIRSILSDEIANGLVEVERDGDKIILRLGEQDSFDSGRAELKGSFEATLKQVGLALKDVGGMIKISGHTDNVPVGFSSRYQSNWDLSAARSASVADYILDSSGLQPGNISVAGFADSKPIASNDTPEGRARNRRIEVMVDG